MNKTQQSEKVQPEKKLGRTFEGVVASVKMQKTVVVEIVHVTKHPLYKKAVRTTRRFVAHNELTDLSVGDRVVIAPTRPISKTKHYVVVKKMTKTK